MLRCRQNEHLTLVDIREMDIQAQDSVVAFQRVLTDPSKTSKRLAFVVARSLARMQIKRAADSRDARYFSRGWRSRTLAFTWINIQYYEILRQCQRRLRPMSLIYQDVN